MKLLKKLGFVAISLSIMLLGCTPDNVGPTKDNSGNKNAAGAFDDPHPDLSIRCKTSDSIFFRSLDGSFNVNKCVTEDWFSPELEPCAPDQPKWGSYLVYNGYEFTPTDTIAWLVVEFSLANGIFNDLSNWTFTTGNGIGVDPQTGFPVVGTDWSGSVANPVRNQWKVQIRLDQLPQPSFDLACRMSILRLSFFADEIPGTRTNLWAINERWNEPQGEYASNNEFALRYTPLNCLPTPCQTATNTVCERVFTGITCGNNVASGVNSRTLTADAGTATNATYLWSTGETTPSIAVTPTVNTNYVVTVTSGGCNIRVTTYNVNVTNVSCQVADHRADFCPANLDVRPGQSFNIRNYVRMKDATTPDWGNLRFTYTELGANAPTNPSNWNLNAFNAGQVVTAVTNDAATGRGNMGRGEYRIFVYRIGQTTYDDYMTIRIHPSRASNVTTAICTSNACGYIPGVRVCNVPPGNPGGASSVCVGYSELSNYVTGVCGSTGGNPGNYLGTCGTSPCGNN